MFYLSYLRSELFRRKSRTILTLLGLAIGVALVITISALSDGLDDAQAKALNPLSSIGTDLTVTLQPQEADTSTGAFAGPGGGAFPGGGGGGREVLQANQAAITDLSKLGKPGTHFVHDFFLPGTQLTFPASQAQQIAALPGVASVATGLMLSGVHQEGTVPKIVAKIKTGGDRLTVTGRVRFQPTEAERQKIQDCFRKAIQQSGGTVPTAPADGGNGAAPNGGGSLGGQAAGRSGGRRRRARFFFGSGAAQKCLPAQFRNFSRTVVTPQQTIQQLVAPPQTNIKSSSYTIGGVDTTKPGIGVVTPSLVSKGRFLSAAGGKEALLAATYASRQKLEVGSKLDLNGTVFTVVGLVRPPLGGQSADVYIPVAELQKLSSQDGLANVVLVRAKDGSSVAAVQREIEQKFPNAEVASQKQVTDQISGSLVDASDLSHRLGVALAILAALAAFLLAALLTLSSVGKRVREIGTLKALGWTQRLVLRQIVGESAAQGILGGLLGVVLGVIAATAIGAFGPTLDRDLVDGRRLGRVRARAARPRARSPTRSRSPRRSRRACCFRLPARGRRRPDRGRGRSVPRRAAPPRRRAAERRVMAGEPLYDVRNASRFFSKGSVTVRALDRVDLDDRSRRIRRARGPERLGQDDAAPAARRARPAERGRGALRGPRPREAARQRARRAAAARVRVRVPAVQPDPDADRACRTSRSGSRPTGVPRASSRSARWRCWPRWASPIARPSSRRALGRRAAAGRDRARPLRRAARDPRRRADREPGHEDGQRRDRLAREPRRRARRDGRRRNTRRRPGRTCARRLAMRDGAIVAAAPAPA